MALSLAIGDYPHTNGFREMKLESTSIDFVEVNNPIPTYFRRMIRDGEFDICEMGITTYFAAMKYGADFVSLPIFTTTGYPFKNIVINTAANIESVKDLEGKRVAARTYTVTAVVWARGLLQQLFGLDIDNVTWVINDYEHTKEFEWPRNVEFLEGADLSALIDSGNVAAGVGIYRGDGDNVKPLFVDPLALEQLCFEETQIFPLNHCLMVKRELLETSEAALGEIYRAFDGARKSYFDATLSGSQSGQGQLWAPPPLEYGVEANRTSLEALRTISIEQQILPDHFGLDDLFWEPSANSSEVR